MGESSEHAAHPIARRVFEHLVRAEGWCISQSGLEEIEAALVELRGSIELVGALTALASIAEFLSSRDGGEAARALFGIMLGFERDLKAINGRLGAEVVEKRAQAARGRAEKLLGSFALARTLDRSPAPAGAARWWTVR